MQQRKNSYLVLGAKRKEAEQEDTGFFITWVPCGCYLTKRRRPEDHHLKIIIQSVPSQRKPSSARCGPDLSWLILPWGGLNIPKLSHRIQQMHIGTAALLCGELTVDWAAVMEKYWPILQNGRATLSKGMQNTWNLNNISENIIQVDQSIWWHLLLQQLHNQKPEMCIYSVMSGETGHAQPHFSSLIDGPAYGVIQTSSYVKSILPIGVSGHSELHSFLCVLVICNPLFITEQGL